MNKVSTHSVWRIAGYLAYGLVLFVLLLFARFPADKFKQYCENRLGGLVSDTACTIDRIEYRMPFTMIFTGIHVRSVTESRASGLTVDRLAISLDSLRSPEAITLAGDLYGGQMSARLAAGDLFSGKIVMNDIRLRDLNAAALQKDLGPVDRKINGTLSVSGRYQAAVADFTGGIGEGRVEMAAGTVALLQPVLSLSQIDFSHLSGNISYEKNRLTVKDGVLKGSDLAGDFFGEIILAKRSSQSELQMGGRLVAQAAFLQAHPQEEKMLQAVMKRYNMTALPFRVGGTLDTPIFRLGN
ncbi:MAG: type II secretion system protein GspN [Desulforhopalus sp.]|nr:type II secretion system protein GspN [Desulforhopalus sp.]